MNRPLAPSSPVAPAWPSGATETSLHERFGDLHRSLDDLARQATELDRWGDSLARAFRLGGKVLVAGNGGSAALAAHLTAELVGRFDRERPALPAIWLGADQATLTALANDYGIDELFARQIDAFARPGDVVLLLSTSGRSPDLLHAAARAKRLGATCWALTGAAPNPLVDAVDRAVSVPGSTAVVQEVHQVAIHLVCERLEHHLDRGARSQAEAGVATSGRRS